jgi:hypothetical protein
LPTAAPRSPAPQSLETRAALKTAAAIADARRAGDGGAFAGQHVLALGANPAVAPVELVIHDAAAALLVALTLEELCTRYGAPCSQPGAFGVLARAQAQWSAFAVHEPRAEPLLPLLRPLGACLARAAAALPADAAAEPRYLWLVVEMATVPLPPGLVWGAAAGGGGGGGGGGGALLLDEETGAALGGHPYAPFFRAKLERARHTPAAAHQLLTDPHHLADGALAWRGDDGDGGAGAGAGGHSGFDAGVGVDAGVGMPGSGLARPRAAASARPAVRPPPPGLQVYQAILGGSPDGVQRYCDAGGAVDAYYRDEWGWDGVGPEWAWSRPTAGTTPLNYVCTLLDVVGDDVAAQMARTLLAAGADPFRDDCDARWFLPVHNAAANGGPLTLDALLVEHPDLASATTGDGQTTLFVAALCERPDDRRRVVERLLRPAGGGGADAGVKFVEPFAGETALHAYARAGYADEVALLCEAGADPRAQNDAGRTPAVEGERALEAVLAGIAAEGGAGGSSAEAGGGDGLSTEQRLERVEGLTRAIEVLGRY